jgi:hypothetical protein
MIRPNLAFCSFRDLSSVEKAAEQIRSTSYAVFIRKMWKSGPISLQLNPTFSAVSNLSPVSIQILMPDSCKFFIVSGTYS